MQLLIYCAFFEHSILCFNNVSSFCVQCEDPGSEFQFPNSNFQFLVAGGWFLVSQLLSDPNSPLLPSASSPQGEELSN
jgi:hypothetical protein